TILYPAGSFLARRRRRHTSVLPLTGVDRSRPRPTVGGVRPGVNWGGENMARLSMLRLAGLVGLTGMATAAVRAPDPAYRAEIETWRAQREARLRSDGGCLQVVGLFWLKPGPTSFGTDPANGIVLPTGSAPARAGV